MNHDFQGGADPVYENFIARQIAEGLELAASSELLKLEIQLVSPFHAVAEFRCTGLVSDGCGDIREQSVFHVGIRFPFDYLRRALPFEMLRMFTPGVWHPNVSLEGPYICIGRLTPGTSLVDILYQCFDVITYQKYNSLEDDSLNKKACAWARANKHRFPVDRRPLKRRSLNLEVHPHAAG
jgi:ubiquitin-protein ligase